MYDIILLHLLWWCVLVCKPISRIKWNWMNILSYCDSLNFLPFFFSITFLTQLSCKNVSNWWSAMSSGPSIPSVEMSNIFFLNISEWKSDFSLFSLRFYETNNDNKMSIISWKLWKLKVNAYKECEKIDEISPSIHKNNC